MVEVDPELRRYRVDIHSLAVGFPEPASAYKLQMTFQDDFGEDLPFRKFGYMSFEAFLSDHPDMQRVQVDGKMCYRAKLSERTADIQSLVSRQKKKKKRKNNTRGHFQRNNQTKSFHVRPNSTTPFFPNQNQRSFRGKSGPQPAFARASFTAFPRHAPVNYNQPIYKKKENVEPVVGPAVGKARILAALKKCLGTATLTKLNFAYQTLYNSQLDRNEMMKYFGTPNFRTIHNDYLAEEFDINPTESGQWVFLSKEVAKQQKDWSEAHQNVIVTQPAHVWDKPTLKELFDKVVAMLVNMYPEPLNVANIAEVYKRAHGVHVDPEDLYSKKWTELVGNTFRDKMQLKPDGSIVLTEKAVRDHKLGHKLSNAVTTTVTATVKRVTAQDLGLEYSEESDSDEDDTGSQSSTSTLSSSVSTAGRARVTDNEVATKTYANRHGPYNVTSTLPVVEEQDRDPKTTKNQLPMSNKSGRESVFNRITFPSFFGKKPTTKPSSALPSQKSPFDTTLSSDTARFETGFKSAFNRPNPMRELQDCLDREMDTSQTLFSSAPKQAIHNVPSSDNTKKSSGFSFMKTFGKNTGFGFKKTDSEKTKIVERGDSNELPYNLWPTALPSANSKAIGKENTITDGNDSANGLVLSPGNLQVKLPENIANRMRCNGITRTLVGIPNETNDPPKTSFLDVASKK